MDTRSADADPASATRALTRREQKLQTALNVATLLVLGVWMTALVLRGSVTVPHGLPTPLAFVLEIAAYVLLFDAYFYVLHRLMHTRIAYPRVHALHHRARDLDVWSALAMHPIEFLAIVGFVPLAMALAPIHLPSLAAVCSFLAVSIAFAHSGVTLPERLDRALGRLSYLTPRIHATHHQRSRCNYGATTTLFDRLLGTLHA